MQTCLPFIMYNGSGFLKYFKRSLHVRSLDLTSVKSFRTLPLTVFEILRFKLKNKNNMKIGEIDFLPYIPCLYSNSHKILGRYSSALQYAAQYGNILLLHLLLGCSAPVLASPVIHRQHSWKQCMVASKIFHFKLEFSGQ